AHDVRSVRVSDAQASAAQHAFADDHRILVELSCGAALAAVYTPVVEVAFADSVVVVVCGGAGVTLDSLSNSAGA
ncbi:MAG: serine dehydratase, partial [Armatimonadetes bacterium CG17_big_fil_post_rev_8_21_14_2_50_66_6]